MMRIVAVDGLDEAVRGGDLDELVRFIDRLCRARDWEALDELRLRCARAHETGHQLWPAASHAAYRLALEAPAHYAARVLDDDTIPFALGPLPEVVAQTHEWHDLAEHVTPSAAAVITAHERVLRGEDLSGIELPGPAVLEVPLHLASWEPTYALAEYHADHAEFPMPDVPRLQALELPSAPSARHDDATDALLDLVRAWVSGSNGRAHAVAVEGDAPAAIAATGASTARATAIEPALAVALMAWAGASGGAHGRRPGAAAGRFGAWWASAALANLIDDWPPDPERLGDAISELGWMWWQPDEADAGWRLHLAIEDAARGRAWCIQAVDSEAP